MRAKVTCGVPAIISTGEVNVVKQEKAVSTMTWTVVAVVKEEKSGLCTMVEIGHNLEKTQAEEAAKSTDRISGLGIPGVWTAKIITVPTSAYHNFFGNICRHLCDVKITNEEEAPPTRQLTGGGDES